MQHTHKYLQYDALKIVIVMIAMTAMAKHVRTAFADTLIRDPLKVTYYFFPNLKAVA